ncbi:MAG: hypothetical protein SFW36_19085 [Leptolyngbyaceae cyanobacterium bins.59]|nr:hypothetical protein [Leptolyngbyaceae cyanobacterium bins.59]
MTDPMQEHNAIHGQQEKPVGMSRATRIRNILRDAATQVLTEVREGTGEARTIARNNFSTTVENSSGKTSEATENPSTTSKTSDFRRIAGKVFSILGKRLTTQLDREYPKWRDHYAGARNRVATVNTELSERYSDRYATAKQQLDKAANWYETTRAKAEVAGTLPLEQQQEVLQGKASEAGASAARKERQLRQQIREFLQKRR